MLHKVNKAKPVYNLYLVILILSYLNLFIIITFDNSFNKNKILIKIGKHINFEVNIEMLLGTKEKRLFTKEYLPGYTGHVPTKNDQFGMTAGDINR